ncbi:unnamed protein product, partial [Sphacelaria rigidula]
PIGRAAHPSGGTWGYARPSRGKNKPNNVFVRLRVERSGCDHSLQLSQSFIPRVLFFVFITAACSQLNIDILLRDIKRLSGRLLPSYRKNNGPRGGPFQDCND